MRYTESNLVFDFPKHWIVKKYDTHPFYKGMSGVGLSAVDFIVVTQEDTILLIEVKNYCNRPSSQVPHITNLLVNQENGLASSFVQKLQETITGVRAIAAYLRKSKWYHLCYSLLQKIGAKYLLLKNDRLFWLWLHEQVQQAPEKIVPVLWLELPDNLAHHQIELNWQIMSHLQTSSYGTPQIWNLKTKHLPFHLR